MAELDRAAIALPLTLEARQVEGVGRTSLPTVTVMQFRQFDGKHRGQLPAPVVQVRQFDGKPRHTIAPVAVERTFIMQAKDSVTAQVFRWTSSQPDFEGAGYPGPNSPTEIALAAVSGI